MNNKIYSNNNILLEIVNNLNQILNYSHDNIIIKILGDIVNKINYIINENQKSLEIIKNYTSSLSSYNQMNIIIDELKINNTNNQQELKFKEGKYVGQVINGIPEGKGTWYATKEPSKGERYAGDWRNGKKEGKGIYYYNSGNIYKGDFKNGKKDGKGIFYYNNGDRFEGDYRNDKREGKGIY